MNDVFTYDVGINFTLDEENEERGKKSTNT